MTGSAGSVHTPCVRVVFSSSGPLYETDVEEKEKEEGDVVPPSRPPESSGVALLHSKLSAHGTNH